MHFEGTDIEGVFIVSSERNIDLRGWFARIYSRPEFAGGGLELSPEQCSLSHNPKRGVVRGLHFQMPPHAEAKLVCCVAGSAFDVVVDLRRKSSTYGRAAWFPLSAERPSMIFVPEGCAHGFQTLEDHTTLLYMISVPYEGTAAAGIRWNDPALGIPWPRHDDLLLSERDRALPFLSELPPTF